MSFVCPVLPESRNLQFDCGVKVQLGFAAEFSNIMIIYTRILETPKDISYCSAHVTDLPEVCRSLLKMQLCCEGDLWFSLMQCDH